MKSFEYRGYDQQGRRARGLLDAQDPKEAREKLANRGILAERLTPAGDGRSATWAGRRAAGFGLADRAALYRELGALLRAGLPMAPALELLIDAPELGAARPLLAGMRDRIRDGAAFGAALQAASPRVKPFESAAVESGEMSGTLGDVLDRLAQFMEEQVALRDKVQTALIYPAVVIGLAGLIATLALGVMLPRFARLFSDAHVALPALTRGALAAGRVFPYAVGIGLALAAGGIAWGVHRWRSDARFRVRLDAGLYRLPLVGRGYTALVNLRFARTLAMLLRGGVTLVNSLQLAGRATASAWLVERMAVETEAIRHGSSLANALRRVPPLAGSLPGWVQAGEASGALAPLLEQAAQRYQQQWDRLIARALALLEPLLILLMGALVLLLALAILMPIMTMNNALQ